MLLYTVYDADKRMFYSLRVPKTIDRSVGTVTEVVPTKSYKKETVVKSHKKKKKIVETTSYYFFPLHTP